MEKSERTPTRGSQAHSSSSRLLTHTSAQEPYNSVNTRTGGITWAYWAVEIFLGFAMLTSMLLMMINRIHMIGSVGTRKDILGSNAFNPEGITGYESFSSVYTTHVINYIQAIFAILSFILACCIANPTVDWVELNSSFAYVSPSQKWVFMKLGLFRMVITIYVWLSTFFLLDYSKDIIDVEKTMLVHAEQSRIQAGNLFLVSAAFTVSVLLLINKEFDKYFTPHPEKKLDEVVVNRTSQKELPRQGSTRNNNGAPDMGQNGPPPRQRSTRNNSVDQGMGTIFSRQ
jgi:hypothetical protein